MKKSILPKVNIMEYMKADKRLAEAILEAFSKLYIYDKDLISRPTKYENNDVGLYHHVGERAIVFRFAYYLQQVLDEKKLFFEYNLDCEYNRNGSKPKRLNSLEQNVYPDLIIHQRGSNDMNLLVMEFKTYWNNKQKHDIEKIKVFLENNEIDSYNYKYGIAVLINKSSVNLKLIDKDNQIFEDNRVYK